MRTRSDIGFKCGAILLALLIGGFAATGQGAEPGKTPTVWPPRCADEVIFSGGMLELPSLGQRNNRGTITDQTVPGQTHIDTVLDWRFLEPKKDQWDWREFDEMLALSRARNLKMLVLPLVIYVPEWFKPTDDYTPLTEMRSGKSVDMLSPWSPGTAAAYDHFYAELARRYSEQIDVIKLAYAGSDYGEVGMLMGAGSFLPGADLYRRFPQDPAVWKAGYWCGDRYARADFRAEILKQYGSLARLNAAWGTRFARPEDIEFPDPERRGEIRRRWLDFMTWYQDSQTRNLVTFLQVIRKHFPHTLLDVPLGYGSDQPNATADRTAICRAAAAFKPISIRSTQGSFNRGMPRAYWFYKRIAPVCHRLGVGLGTEPPGGDLSYDELERQYFEDASAGINFVFQYFQNYHLRPNVIDEYKHVLRPQEQSLVDIGVLYPSTEMLLQFSAFPGWPGGQVQFCHLGREYFDYDVVDENMIGWGMLDSYKVLLHTDGTVFRAGTLSAIDAWLKAGGILITRGLPQWENWGGGSDIAAAWSKDEERSAARPAVRVYRVGKGRIYAANVADKIPDYLKTVVAILTAMAKAQGAAAPLHGFNGKNDGKYVTDFPSGRLMFDPKTLATKFFPE